MSIRIVGGYNIKEIGVYFYYCGLIDIDGY